MVFTACRSESATEPGESPPAPRPSVATAATSASFIVTPVLPIPLANVAGVAGDGAPGFASGSIAANATTAGAKSEIYLTPGILFGREVLVGEIADISYWTRTGATHTVDFRDWALLVYTQPFTGDVSTPGWYGARFGAEPYFAASLNDPAGTWNRWSATGPDNHLRFYESTQGAPGANFGTYADPHLPAFLSANSLGTTVPRSSQSVLFFSLQTGSAWANGFTGQLDGLRIELTDGSVASINFEPALGSCAVQHSGSTFTLLSDCVTSQTVVLPDGHTLDGNGFRIIAVDPVPGHFLGAVVKNGGATAHVTNLTVTASGLANVCDEGNDRLRGILFDGAAGTITNNTVVDVNQGPSGCQEGNAIEVRNAPFDNTGADLLVTITGNMVSGYIKNAITANGSVAATILDNIVTGSGPVGVPLAAQNGIQVGFGATAIVRGNTITGNNYTPKSFVACGLLVFQADGVRAAANQFSGNERDVCNFGKGGGNYNPEP